MEGQTQQILSREIQVLRVITSWLYLVLARPLGRGGLTYSIASSTWWVVVEHKWQFIYSAYGLAYPFFISVSELA